jgi:hypothetical protein
MDLPAVAATSGPRLCAICSEFGAAAGCFGGHVLCRSCVAACARMNEKLLGVTDLPPICPIAECVEYVRVAEQESAAPRRLARLIRLDRGAPKYEATVNAFRATMGSATVHDVFRVENPALRAVYRACRERLVREGRVEGANENRLFHATTRAAAGSIVREGFDTHRAGKAHGAALGAGIYVASDARFSHRYSDTDSVGLRAMFLCAVLLGKNGKNSKSDGGAPPGQYAVFREQQVFPAYLIMYTV